MSLISQLALKPLIFQFLCLFSVLFPLVSGVSALDTPNVICKRNGLFFLELDSNKHLNHQKWTSIFVKQQPSVDLPR